MKIFYNSKIAKLLTFLGGYKTIMLFRFVFTEKDSLSEYEKLHELIHRNQYDDCFILGLGFIIILDLLLMCLGVSSFSLLFTFLFPLFLFYIWYGIEYLFNRCTMSHREAYRSINFERQAIDLGNEWEKPENERTKYEKFSWFNYLR